jgi:hypothetical protein
MRVRFAKQYRRSCQQHGVNAELDEDSELDEVYEEFQDHTNMTESELEKWSGHPCSREASLDPEAVLRRNINLHATPKSEWTEDEIEDAERTISFISRMKAQRPDEPREGPSGCPSKWAISLMNWGFNPFSSMPEQTDEIKDSLEPVEQIEMSEHPNTIEAERLAASVWELKDHLGSFYNDYDRLARELEETDDNDRVEEIREELKASIKFMLRRIEEPIMDIKGEGATEEMESNRSYEFTPIPKQVLYADRGDAVQRARDLGLSGVHEHPVIFRSEDEIPEDLMQDTTVYFMPGGEHSDWSDRVSDEGYEFEPVPSHVLYADRSKAEERAENLGISGVHPHPVIFRSEDEIPESVMEDVTVYHMAGEEHGDWTDRVRAHPENSQSREAAQVFHADQERNAGSTESDNTVRVQPTSVHKVGTDSNLETEEEVRDALESLWDE